MPTTRSSFDLPIRTVNDPAMVKAKAEKVCRTTTGCTPFTRLTMEQWSLTCKILQLLQQATTIMVLRCTPARHITAILNRAATMDTMLLHNNLPTVPSTIQ